MTYDSKNTHERNKEIAQILGRFDQTHEIASMNMALIAVQSLSTGVLKEIKRDNIDFSGIEKLVAEYHEKGVRVTTDVIYGLPGEDLEEAILTIRKCFDIGFDYISINRALMLPGAEMETEQSRKHYGLKTKFMVRRGSYGDYSTKDGNIRAMEVDELVSSTPTFGDEDILTFNTLTWLVFFSWNHGRLASIMNYIRDETDANPVDLLLKLMEIRDDSFSRFSDMLVTFRQDVDAVMFDDQEEMRKHFYEEENWQSLLSYIRVELRYNAMLYSDYDLHKQMCLAVEVAITELGLGDDEVLKDLLAYVRANFVDVHGIVKDEPSPVQTLSVSGAALQFIEKAAGVKLEDSERYEVVLRKSPEDQAATKQFLLDHDYTSDPINAIERLLGARYTSVIHDYPHIMGDPAFEMQAST
jgi:hypothetical protein